MKKNVLFITVYILAFLVITANTVTAAVQSLFPDISDLPKGDIIESTVSPNGTSRVDFYVVKNNLGTAIRGECVRGSKRANIYWQTGIDSVDVEWLDEQGIIINNIPLNIKTDKFDSRRGTAIFSEGVLAERITEND